MMSVVVSKTPLEKLEMASAVERRHFRMDAHEEPGTTLRCSAEGLKQSEEGNVHPFAIKRDSSILDSRIAKGRYAMVIKGNKGGISCFARLPRARCLCMVRRWPNDWVLVRLGILGRIRVFYD